MTIAVLGAGAREHALATRLRAERGDDAVVVTPGGVCVPGSVAAPPRDPELVIVGPEALLADGVADRLRASGIAVVGPGREEARLESSKAWSKAFMERHGVATARSRICVGVTHIREAAHAELARGEGVVLKYDGLAAGKGVFVCDDADAVEQAMHALHDAHGAESTILVEERLRGRELSLLALVAGGQARLFPPVEDHKQLEDGDRGPLTGGMGVSYPIPHDGLALRATLQQAIVEPTLRGLRAELPDYRGVLFFGVMLTDEGPKLLEYNVRFGDPEAQVLTTAMAESLSALCMQVANGTPPAPGWVQMAADACVCVVLAAPGYPRGPLTVTPVCVAPHPGISLYHAATRMEGERLVSAGGRVLSVVATGASLQDARSRVYAALRETPLHYRRDIGARR